MIKQLLLCLFLASFFACSSPKKAEGPAADLDAILDDYFEETLKLYPLMATSIGDNRFNDQLTIPISKEEREKALALTEKTLERLKPFDCAKLQEQSQLTCEMAKWELTIETELRKNDLSYLVPFDQWSSFFSDFAELASGLSFVPFNSASDYRNFMKRAERVPQYIDVMIANMREGMKKKVTTPRILVDKGLKQLKTLLNPDITQTVFYKPLLKMDQVAQTERAKIKADYEETIRHTIIPAYQKLYHFVQKDYRPHTRTTSGLLSIPGGKKYYRSLVKYYTTTSLSPDEIYTIGTQEVARIQKEFEKAKEQMGFKGSLKEFFHYLNTNPKLFPFHSAEEVMNGYREIHTRIMKEVPNHFRLQPKAPFQIKEIDKFKAENASEGYQHPPGEGKPGTFWVPIPDPKKYSSKEMESLFLHEAIPGHHFQIALQQEMPLSRYRRYSDNTAYVEGWALYTESLGKDLGLYQDPVQWVGRLTQEMHRAIRLVVDTGIHAKGWSREKAIRYTQDHEPTLLPSIIQEIERYMAYSGQALAYKIGEMKIRELKQEAKDRLGKAYDDRDFHDQILKDGALPLSILDAKMQRWIKR